MNKQADFEGYLISRNDEIDNLSYQLAIAFCKTDPDRTDEDVLPWNMEIIGEINETVQSILKEHGLPTCWPYHENEVPCYMTNTCSADICSFKKDKLSQTHNDGEEENQ